MAEAGAMATAGVAPSDLRSPCGTWTRWGTELYSAGLHQNSFQLSAVGLRRVAACYGMQHCLTGLLLAVIHWVVW